jgi:ribonuclease BN (tRNA processing enzyme)
MDHNADFFQFVIGGWSRGRTNLSLYGPPGTERLVESLEYIYDEDITYRQHLGYPLSGIDDIECNEVFPEDNIRLENIDVTIHEVDHSIRTYAYRFEDVRTGDSVVFSGDTDYVPQMDDFAADADVLVHDCCMAPPAPAQTDGGFVWEEFTKPLAEEKRRRLADVHADAEEAATVAANAGVETLVLTHLLPYRDRDEIRESARAVFDGNIVIAEDNMTIPSTGLTQQ